MTSKTLLAIGLVASTVAAGTANADGARDRDAGGFARHGSASYHGSGDGMMHGPGRDGGMGDMMQMMMRMHGQMGAGGMIGGPGEMQGPGMMGGAFHEAFDTDGDGIVSSQEMRAGLEALLARYDADGSGTLSIAEFETLFGAMIRSTMVDRFQALDEDGDGSITAAEMTAPADRMNRMEMMRGRGVGTINGPMPMTPGAGGGTMMKDN